MIITDLYRVKEKMKPYGKELILDLHHCNPKTFTRESISKYFEELCELIEMERCKLCWWDDVGVPIEEQQTEAHLKGTTAVQFILTSNIVIHTLDILEKAYINLFSCKSFNENEAKAFSEKWFEGEAVGFHVIERL